MKTILKSGFLAALVAVLAVGFTVASQPAGAIPGPPGPTTDCPTAICPSNLAGYTPAGSCTTNYGHGCVEVCNVYRCSGTGQYCKSTTNCIWW